MARAAESRIAQDTTYLISACSGEHRNNRRKDLCCGAKRNKRPFTRWIGAVK
jgi:hypothetical protein